MGADRESSSEEAFQGSEGLEARMRELEALIAAHARLLAGLGGAVYVLDHRTQSYDWVDVEGLVAMGIYREPFTPQALSDQVVSTRVGPLAQADTVRAMKKRILGGEQSYWDAVYEVRCQDGVIRWIRDYAVPIAIGDGAIKSLGVLADETETRLALARRDESEARYRELIESIAEVLFRLDEQGVITYISPVVRQAAGFEPEDLIGKPFWEFVFPPDRERMKLAFEADRGRGERQYEFRSEVSPKDVRWLRASVRPSGESGAQGLTGILSDITETKRAASRLMRSETRLQAILENSSDVILLLGTDGRVLFESGSLSRSQSALWPAVGERFASTAHPEDTAEIRELIRQVLREPDRSASGDLRILSVDGGYTIFEALFRNLTGTPGVDAILVNLRDVTARHEAEMQVREREARYESLFHFANDAILIIDRDRVVQANRKALELFRCTNEQLLGSTVSSISPDVQPDGRVSADNAREQLTRAYQGRHSIFNWRHLRFDGTEVDVEVSLGRTNIAGREYVQAHLRELSPERRR